MLYIAIFLGLACFGTIAFLVWFLSSRLKNQTLAALHETLLLVTVPQRRNTDGAPITPKEYIAVADQFFSSFASILSHSEKLKWPPLGLEMAVHLLDEEIHFYLVVPEQIVSEFIKEINTFYPDAHVEQPEDYTIFHPQGATAMSYLEFSHNSLLPLKTYPSFEADPLLSFVNALTKVAKQGEGAAIQIIIKPGIKDFQAKAHSAAKKLMEGISLSEVFGGSGSAVSKEFFSMAGELMGNAPKKPAEPVQKIVGPAEQHIAQIIQEKASKQNFKVNIRLVASAATKDRADMILSTLETPFGQLSNPSGNSLKPHRLSGGALRRAAYNFSFRLFEPRQEIILNSEELASLWHFPPQELPAPKIKWLKARSSEPPTNMPEEGLLLGENDFRNEKRLVKISTDDRRRHFYVVGQTGTGKSTLLYEMIRQDMEEGRGVAVIDPHGALVDPLLSMVPKGRAEDVIYFNPGMTERPMGLNMLEWDNEEQKDFAVSEMINIFMKLFPPEYIGPMFEHDMRNAMLTIMADRENPGTLAEIPRIFTDKEFIKTKLEKVTDPIVRAYWEKEVAQTSDFHKSEKLGYLISKLGRFLENSMMRNIIGQSKSSFNFREVMDSQKILLVNLAKGKIGEMNAYLLGMIIVSKILIAALSRGDTAENFRKDFYLYIDEFQNFTTDSVASILAEARKYRLNLIIAHQFLGQLPQNIRDAVFGNVGSLVSFRVGPEDASFLEQQFAPVFNANDLVNIENANAYVRLLIQGYPARPFNMHTFADKKGDEQWARQVTALSLMKYGRPKELVEREIFEKLNAGMKLTASATQAK